MKLDINPNWNYNQITSQLKALKREYHHVLASFSYFHLHDKVLFITETKKQIYSLNFEKWKCDRIWEVINNDFSYNELLEIKNRR